MSEYKPSVLVELLTLPHALVSLPYQFAAEPRARRLGWEPVERVPENVGIDPGVRADFESACSSVASLGFERIALLSTSRSQIRVVAAHLYHGREHTAALVGLVAPDVGPFGSPASRRPLSVSFANRFIAPHGDLELRTSNSRVRPFWLGRRRIDLRLQHITAPSDLLQYHRALVRRYAEGTPNPQPVPSEIPAYLQRLFDEDLERWNRSGLIRFDPNDPDAYYYTMKGARSLAWSRTSPIKQVVDALDNRRNRRLADSLVP